MERNLSYEEVILFRSIADAIGIKEKQLVHDEPSLQHSKLRRWFESWIPGSEQEEEIGEEVSSLHFRFATTRKCTSCSLIVEL